MYRYWATVDIDQMHAQHDQIQAVCGNCAWVSPKPDEATASSKTRKARTGVCSPELKKRSGPRQHSRHKVAMSEAMPLLDVYSPAACQLTQTCTRQTSSSLSANSRPPWASRQTLPAYLLPAAQADRQQHVPDYPFSAFKAGRDHLGPLPPVTSSFSAQLSSDNAPLSCDNDQPPSEGLSQPQSHLMLSPFSVHPPHIFNTPLPNNVDVVLVAPPASRRDQPQSPFDTARNALPCLFNSPAPHRPDVVPIMPSTPRRPQLQSPFSKACTAHTASSAEPRAVESTQELLDRVAHVFSTSGKGSDNLWGPPATPRSLSTSDCNELSSDCNDAAYMSRPVQSGTQLLHKLQRLSDTAGSLQACA